MQRDGAVVVRRALVHEVDDDARLLARVHPHDPPDPLLVDALARSGRQVHDDGRARRVPALGEEHRVDEDVDLAALVAGEDLGELDRRSLAADGLGLQARGPELLREVVGVLDPGRVDDPRRRVEAVAVEARRGLVQSRVVEDCRERALLEVAADDRDRVDRGRRRHAEVAQRRDQSAAGGVLERKVVDRGREDVRDLFRDQLLGRRHPDVDGIREAADRGTRLLAERRVRLVGDHELVRLAADAAVMAREPGVGLDRDRVRLRRGLALLDDGRQPVAVALRRELTVELRDEQSAVGQDEDAHRARGLDEPGRRDRLARRRRMAEAVAANRARVLLGRELFGQRLLSSSTSSTSSNSSSSSSTSASACPFPFTGSSARWFAAISSVSIPASASTWWRRSSVPEARSGGFSDSTRSRPSMSAKRTFHCDEGSSRPASISARRLVQRVAPRRALGEHVRRLLAVVEQRLARPVFGAFRCGDEFVRRRTCC